MLLVGFYQSLVHDWNPITDIRQHDLARADWLLFFDIDHILTDGLIQTCLVYEGDKLHWVRRLAILDEGGTIVTDLQVLRQFGMTDDTPSVHGNSFLIRRGLFKKLGGYDERFCGRYGGDDVDFNQRYRQLVSHNEAKPEELCDGGYVYPDPAADTQRLFHSLTRTNDSVAG